MKKIFPILKAIFKGVKSAMPIISNISEEIKKNKSDKEGGEGKVSLPRLIAYLLAALLVIARIIWPEYINIDTIEEVLSQF